MGKTKRGQKIVLSDCLTLAIVDQYISTVSLHHHITESPHYQNQLMTRIGILIKDFNQLQNWELRIIENIKNDSSLTLALLVKDGNEERGDNKSKKTLSKYLFSKQVSFENKRYLSNIQTVNKKEIFEYLNTIPTVKIKPKSVDDLDIFNEKDSQKVKEYKLDVLLKLGFNLISGEILNASKYGIWQLFHGDQTKVAGPPGFWEILTRQPVVEVKLVQLTGNHSGLLIDKAYFNRHNFSFVETNTRALESSVSLLFKYLRKIKSGNFLLPDTVDKNITLGNTPKPLNSLNYSLKYFNGFFNGFLQKIQGRFGIRSNHWTFFIGKGNFMEADLSKLKSVKVPNDEFWADPFLYKYEDEYYVFFENYSYKTGLGKISCGKVKDNEFVKIVDVLNFNYHLSYPFVFEEDGEIYMMPETGQNKRLEIYKCINFPDKWELFTTAFEGENVADAFFYNDKLNQKWLFLNKVIAQNTDRTSELYIYKVNSLKLNKLEPHKQNPVIIDARVARNGGAIFKYKNKIYRPSQSNTDGVYGKALNINQIKKLTIEEYQEEVIRKVEPDFKKGLVSIHHLHQIDEMFVFDGALKKM